MGGKTRAQMKGAQLVSCSIGTLGGNSRDRLSWHSAKVGMREKASTGLGALSPRKGKREEGGEKRMKQEKDSYLVRKRERIDDDTSGGIEWGREA